MGDIVWDNLYGWVLIVWDNLYRWVLTVCGQPVFPVLIGSNDFKQKVRLV